MMPGHHRSTHSSSRSRLSHSSSHYQTSHNRSRNLTSSSIHNNSNLHKHKSHSSTSNSHITNHEPQELGGGWSEHRSSSGKVYYYNTKTGVSQWELPAELKQPPQQQIRPVSPESDISESSSIRQQQINCPSVRGSSENSINSDSIPEDKPLLTPSLVHYYKPELIASFNSAQIQELERHANQFSRDSLKLNEKILKESVDLKIAKSVVHYVDISIEAQEKKFVALRKAIDEFGLT